MRRALPKPANAVTVAPGASAVILTTEDNETYGYDVYLRALGVDLSPTSNADFAVFRLRVNGKPVRPFEAMTSRIAPSYDPARFVDPIYLGRGVKVDLFGEIAGGATGNSVMVGSFELALASPGESP